MTRLSSHWGKALVAAAVGLQCGLLAVPAAAGEHTETLSAFDEDAKWQGILGVRFLNIQHTALITRELVCQGGGRSSVCGGTSQILDTRQLAVKESMNVLNIDLRTGLYKDLELSLTLPIVFGWSTSVSNDDGVGQGNSLVDTGQNATSLFSMPYDSPSRAGVGDLSLGLKYAVFNQARNGRFPTWVVSFDYQAPTGTARKAGEPSVGSGIHQITLGTAISRRFGKWAEPYMRVRGNLRFPAGSSPFQNLVVTQTRVGPGHSIGVEFGSEFFPWREPTKEGSYVSIAVGVLGEYVFDGREYTELFDALGTSGCQAASGCQLTRMTRHKEPTGTTFVDPPAGQPRVTDGTTDVERYGRLGATVGVTYQPIRWVRLRLDFTYTRTTSHFITFADAGKTDLNGDGEIDHGKNGGANEFSPYYNENFDDYGRRFRVDASNSYQMLFSVEGRY